MGYWNLKPALNVLENSFIDYYYSLVDGFYLGLVVGIGLITAFLGLSHLPKKFSLIFFMKTPWDAYLALSVMPFW